MDVYDLYDRTIEMLYKHDDMLKKEALEFLSTTKVYDNILKDSNIGYFETKIKGTLPIKIKECLKILGYRVRESNCLQNLFCNNYTIISWNNPIPISWK